ncbi:hypothetical protein, partial [Streptococcus pneumoniae]
KDEICPFSSLAFFQPTTVDKEPKEKGDFASPTHCALCHQLLHRWFIVLYTLQLETFVPDSIVHKKL